VFFSVLIVCVSCAYASTTQPRTKPVSKTGSVKSSAHPVSHTTRSSVPKKVTSKKSSRPSSVTKASRTSSHSSSRVSTKGKKVRSAKAKQAPHSRGQQGIEAERARTIQEALIRAKYMDGEPSGVWDQKTKDALTRFQSDNGWQSKVVPDSRALIKLGLGPNHDDVLNPETSGITTAPAIGGGPAAQLRPGGTTANR
jgi:hypothetical protein